MFEPVHHMFRRTAARCGERVAVECGGRRVTYRELETRALGLASALRERGVTRGEPVAILAGATADVITGILGTLEAGGVFVPLDLQASTNRMEEVLAAVDPRWVFVDEANAPAVRKALAENGGGAQVIACEEIAARTRGDAEWSTAEPDPDGLCYVYFTSGSTGRPKGIAGRLKAIDHFLRWETDAFGIDQDVRCSQLISPAFDAYLRDAFMPLSIGGTVCVPPSREVLLDGLRLVQWLHEERVSIVHCTPSLFRSILGQDLAPSHFPALRYVLLAGEPLLPADVRRWRSVFDDRIELVNLYGPSETTMVKFFHRVQAGDANASAVPVGKPMPGARTILLGEDGQPCPPGKLGEIYIRTPYRALGYWREPELTAEVFIQNPFSDVAGDIVYKTGDLGRMREDGDLEVVGRRDRQVKVRGVRIELGPIEDLLRSHPAVNDVAIVDRVDRQGNKFLCAYLVLRQEVEMSEVGAFLRGRFAEAMVPAAFVVLPAIPRTLSGKVDRRALPEPGHGDRMGRQYVAPRTPVEEQLCGLFQEVLGISRIGIHDSFFELGGHSLLATQLLSRIRFTFGVEVPLGRIFQAPTVEQLALTVIRLEIERVGGEEILALLAQGQSDPPPAATGLTEQRLIQSVAVDHD